MCVSVCAHVCIVRANERNKSDPPQFLVRRPADEGVGFKRNKCWCCSVIFVKNEKANNKKSEETRKGKRGRLYTKRSRDPIFYGITMSIKKKKMRKKNGKQHAER